MLLLLPDCLLFLLLIIILSPDSICYSRPRHPLPQLSTVWVKFSKDGSSLLPEPRVPPTFQYLSLSLSCLCQSRGFEGDILCICQKAPLRRDFFWHCQFIEHKWGGRLKFCLLSAWRILLFVHQPRASLVWIGAFLNPLHKVEWLKAGRQSEWGTEPGLLTGVGRYYTHVLHTRTHAYTRRWWHCPSDRWQCPPIIWYKRPPRPATPKAALSALPQKPPVCKNRLGGCSAGFL